jgi:DNA repair protein RadC
MSKRAHIEMTRVIVEIAKPLGIAAHDNIVVGRAGHPCGAARRIGDRR